MSKTAQLFDDESRGATVSDDGLYRYDLWRRWDDGPLLGWVMCNPSTGDADQDDRTVRRCCGFARREGFAGIVIRNLYAYRTPYPSDLEAAARSGVDVVGPANDGWLQDLAGPAARFRVPKVVAAWGAMSSLRAANPNARELFALRTLRGRLHRLTAAEGMNPGPLAPHPLYLPADTPLSPTGLP